MGEKMKLKKRYFILIEWAFLLIGILLISFIFIDYLNNVEILNNLKQKENLLKKDQEFDRSFFKKNLSKNIQVLL